MPCAEGERSRHRAIRRHGRQAPREPRVEGTHPDKEGRRACHARTSALQNTVARPSATSAAASTTVLPAGITRAPASRALVRVFCSRRSHVPWRLCRSRRIHVRGASTFSSSAARIESASVAFDLELGRGRHAVTQARQRHALHVVRRHVIATRDERHGAGGPDERDAAARACARCHAAPGPRRAHDAHRVVEHRVVHARGRRRSRCNPTTVSGLDERGDLFDVQHLADGLRGHLAGEPALFLECRVADADLQQETVELRLGKRVSAFVLDRDSASRAP